MYVCDECGEVFDSPVIEHDDPSPPGVGLPSGAYKYYYCPNCGSDHIKDGEECKACGEWHITGRALCGACADDLADSLDRLRRGMGLTQDDFEQAIADHFGW